MKGVLVLFVTLGALSCALASSPTVRQLWRPPICPYIENGFDYKGLDIKNVPNAKIEDCCGHCRNTTGCAVWSYTTYNGGTCWLKDTIDEIVVDANVKSARIIPGAGYDVAVYHDVDFQGNDMKNVPGKKVDDCVWPCRNLLGCRAYTWSDYNGGTCWLKSKIGLTIASIGVHSGEAYAYETTAVFPYTVGMKFEGPIVATIDEKDPAKCGVYCARRAADHCYAVTWEKNKCVLLSTVSSGKKVPGAYGAAGRAGFVPSSSPIKKNKKVKIVLRFTHDN